MGALALGIVLAAFSLVAVEGATRTIAVSPEVAAPGDDVTVKIHDYGGMFWGTDLYLIPAARYADGSLCSAMPGAIKVGVIAWTHNGLLHDGLARFTLPVAADGLYALGEQLPGVIPPCGPAGSITVSASRSPNTAMADPEPAWGTLMTVGGLMALLASAGVARAHVSRAHESR
jgi:hypothetical protein